MIVNELNPYAHSILAPKTLYFFNRLGYNKWDITHNLEAYRSGHNEAVLKCDWFQWVYSPKSFYNRFAWLLRNLSKRPIFGIKQFVFSGLSATINRLRISTTKSVKSRILQTFLQNHFHLILHPKLNIFRWRDGRAVECGGLENRWWATIRGFESLSLRQKKIVRTYA